MLPLLVVFAALLILLALGLPYMFSFGVTGFVGLLVFCGWETTSNYIAYYAAEFISSYSLAVIPLFIIMGVFGTAAKLTDDLFEVSYKWLGRLPGGLITTVIGASATIGAITGSGATTVGAIGESVMRRCEERNYHLPMVAGNIAGGSCLGGLIPPSALAVLYAILMETSVGKQLMAGLIPGLVTMILYAAIVITRATINPSLAPAAKGITWKESLFSLPRMTLAIFVFVVVIGGIYSGLMTPTEAAGVGVLVTLVMAVIRERFRWAPIAKALNDAVRLIGLVFGILIGASLLKVFISVSGAGVAIAAIFTDLDVSKTALTLMLLIPYIPLGMFIDSISMILITIPVYFPIVYETGIDPIMFGVLMYLVVAIGLLTPPMGFNVLVMHAIRPDVNIMAIFKEGLWLCAADVVVIVLIVLFPAIALWLPSHMVA